MDPNTFNSAPATAATPANAAIARIATLVAYAAELMAPRNCVLCGLSASLRSRSPLCEECALSFRPLTSPRCRACGRILISESLLCMRCRDRTWSFDEALPLFPYEGPMGRLLAAYKARGRRSLAPFLADFVAEAALARWPGRAIVPVPPRPGKIREKGWDQVELIVHCLEDRGMAVVRPLVRRSAAQQKRLDRKARAANACAGYSIAPGGRIPLSVVLVDDVATTYATAEACAAALRGAGSEAIAFLALAYD